MLFPYNILAFTEIGLPPTYVYVRRMGIVIMPECCVNASLFLIAELRPANFSDVFWCQKSCRFRRPKIHVWLATYAGLAEYILVKEVERHLSIFSLRFRLAIVVT